MISKSRELLFIIEGLSQLLRYGKLNLVEGKNLILEKMILMETDKIIEKLQYHQVKLIYKKSYNLLNTYFETEFKN
jgi:hypothetical protein